MSVFDLPQPWQRPPFEDLHACLESLELKPAIWNHRSRVEDIVAEQEATFTHRREVAQYLSSIIKSPLGWVTEDQRDELWELASRRISERSGRAGSRPSPPANTKHPPTPPLCCDDMLNPQAWAR